MALERRNEYLEALGIDVWIPRQRHARAVPTASTPNAGIVVGPGTGNVLLLCASSAEAAMPLAADIARCLDCEPVWAWPAPAGSLESLPLEQAVAERLFTRMIIFGTGLTWPEIDPAARVMGSARLLQADSIPVLARSAAARKSLWAELSASNWCAPRTRA